MGEYIKRESLMKFADTISKEESSDGVKKVLDMDGLRCLAQNIHAVDAVEVVRCKDCKYLYCCSAIDRRFYCRHWPKGLEEINVVEENPFCSYGERKEGEANE